MSISGTAHLSVDLDEAARQLAQATHDAQVAYDSISLGDLDWAHTHAIIARAEADAAERILRAALSTSEDLAGGRRRPLAQ
jgi:regulator of protease activity HflC (stomatin/prohibitin superfamily)